MHNRPYTQVNFRKLKICFDGGFLLIFSNTGIYKRLRIILNQFLLPKYAKKQRYYCIFHKCNYQFTRLDEAMEPKRLTMEEKLEVLRMSLSGSSCRSIAKDLKLNRSTVDGLIKNSIKIFLKNSNVKKLQLISVQKIDDYVMQNMSNNEVLLRYNDTVVIFKVI